MYQQKHPSCSGFLDPSFRRNPLATDRLIGPNEFGCPTLWDAFIRGYLLAGSSARCLGSRLGLEDATTLPQATFDWWSYGSVYSQIVALSEGFVSLGICGEPPGADSHGQLKGISEGLDQRRVAIWCSNRPSWTIAEYACYRTSITVVSIDDRASSKSASRILNDTKPQAIILPADKFKKLVKVRAAEFLRRRRKLIPHGPLSPLQAADKSLVDNETGEDTIVAIPHFIEQPSGNEFGIENEQPDNPFHDLSMLSDFTSSDSRVRQSSAFSSTGTSDQAMNREEDLLRGDLIYIIIDAHHLPKRVKLKSIALGASFHDFEEVQEQGRLRSQEFSQLIDGESSILNIELAESQNCRRPKQETWAAIIYSSGTTGAPKPSVLTHGNFASNLASFHHLVKYRKLPEMTCADLVQFSYLPLTHIYEKQSQANVFFNGGSIGFSSVLSLRFLEDITILKPTLLTTTPTFLLRQILSNRLNSLTNFESFKSSIESYLLNKAIEEKIKVLKEGHGEKVWLWDRFVLGYLRDRLGGQLKWIVSGTSPLSAHATELLTASLSVRITEGYGLTETCSAACVTILDDSQIFSVGHVGPPLPCCEIKIVDIPPMYTSQDQPFGRGEVHIRGHNVFAGYFIPSTNNSKEVLARAVDADGWLATGDIGFFDNLGNLHIVDRLTPVQATLPQQIHHHFNILNLQKIELSLLNSVKEVEQVFIASSSSNQRDKGEKDWGEDGGFGQIGALISFVVVNVPKFLRWAETQKFVVDPCSDDEEAETRRNTAGYDEEEEDEEGEDGDSSWDKLTFSGTDDLDDGTEPERYAFKLPIRESEWEEFTEQLCRDPKVSKAFLAWLREKGKDVGLKSHELPIGIHLSTDRFPTAAFSSPTTPPQSSDHSPNTSSDESVMTLKMKTEALIHHFLRR
ncbi:hypothetical protein CROQUDRAFT_44310 [Cronartium quercuum f. sp. fusiforme G11]|uniref:AMP-dependent synthetase/ligase domain-containing protein n=1 Tax=Cronartium quercuum f. sp. fusiforme G11 TaxID=708437 RepID=A0A9P6NLT0_9BASI|nr:hypothetical protein CROQUDRAFT_44310 [Cronartium quercuum f. sp. fusiforme G11]